MGRSCEEELAGSVLVKGRERERDFGGGGEGGSGKDGERGERRGKEGERGGADVVDFFFVFFFFLFLEKKKRWVLKGVCQSTYISDTFTTRKSKLRVPSINPNPPLRSLQKILSLRLTRPAHPTMRAPEIFHQRPQQQTYSLTGGTTNRRVVIDREDRDRALAPAVDDQGFARQGAVAVDARVGATRGDVGVCEKLRGRVEEGGAY